MSTIERTTTVVIGAGQAGLAASHFLTARSIDHGELDCRTVVIASGACNRPAVPRFHDAVPPSVEQLTPFDYRGPEQVADGGVLVVGASATGVQLAAELRRSGRPVVLSVGEH